MSFFFGSDESTHDAATQADELAEIQVRLKKSLTRSSSIQSFRHEEIDLFQEPFSPEEDMYGRKNWRGRLYALLESPEESILGTIIGLMLIAFVITGVVAFCLESVPDLSPEIHPEWKARWDVIENIIMFVFSVEYVMRFLATHHACIVFICQPSHVVDLLSIMPFYVRLLLPNAPSDANFVWMRLFRVLRLFRLLKLVQHISSLDVIRKAFVESVEGLGFLVSFLIVCVVLLSALMWCAESGKYDFDLGCFTEATDGEKCTVFNSVPASSYWAITTMTTVGYGDYVPRTWLGKWISAVAMLLGVLVIAMPVTVLSNSFSEAWEQYKKDKHESRLIEKLIENVDSSEHRAELVDKQMQLRACLTQLAELTPEIRVLLSRELSGDAHAQAATMAGYNAAERTLQGAAESLQAFLNTVTTNLVAEEAHRVHRRASI